MSEMETLRKQRAVFSPDRVYRYALWRGGDLFTSAFIAFIGLNPSTADEVQDDPMIRRCKGFANRLGYSAFVMLNLFTYRSTDPHRLRIPDNPTGPENDAWIKIVCDQAELTIACWGNHGMYRNRSRKVRDMLGAGLYCLGTTKDGEPRHPLYLPKDAPIIQIAEVVL